MERDRPPGWADDHHDGDDDHAGATTEDEAFWTPPRVPAPAPFVPRIAFVGDGMLMSTVIPTVVFHCVASKNTPLIVVRDGAYETAATMRLGFNDYLDPARIVGVAYDDRTDAGATVAFLRAVATQHEHHFPDAAVLLLVAPGAAPAVSHALVHFVAVCARTVADALAFRDDADLIVVPEAAPDVSRVPRGTPVFSLRDASNAANDLFTLLRDMVLGGDP